MTEHTFMRTVKIERSAEEVFAWHERPGAFLRLTPPWEKVELVGEHHGIRSGAKVTVKTKVAGMPFCWEIEHRDYVAGRQFRDMQLKGPFSKWEHLHRIEPAGSGACLLSDIIHYRLPLGRLGNAVARKSVEARLDRLFRYRHAVTKADVESLPRERLTILISGASGLVGRQLIPFLQTQGHEVRRLVRRKSSKAGEIFWDPETGELAEDALEGVNAVIHLSGANVAEGRWTDKRRAEIMASRVDSTRTLVAAMERMVRKPEVFLSASATGIYGYTRDASHAPADETTSRGTGFLADVCARWEVEARRAEHLGVRTVIMRLGVVLTPAGGALAKMLPVFKLGLGGRIGSGQQGFSWIALNDLLRAMAFLVTSRESKGVFNLVAPQVGTNADYAKALGHALRRPAVLPVPAWGLRALFGEMAKEALLGGARTQPMRLEASGFEFAHPTLAAAFRHELGLNL